MDYGKQVVVHIDFAYFLKEIIKESFIDDAWIDNEYAEYAMMHYFYRDGILDKNNITICQFNMEVNYSLSGILICFFPTCFDEEIDRFSR